MMANINTPSVLVYRLKVFRIFLSSSIMGYPAPWQKALIPHETNPDGPSQLVVFFPYRFRYVFSSNKMLLAV
jgi:hypothetical protein